VFYVCFSRNGNCYTSSNIGDLLLGCVSQCWGIFSLTVLREGDVKIEGDNSVIFGACFKKRKAVQIWSLNMTACHAEFDGLLSDYGVCVCVCLGGWCHDIVLLWGLDMLMFVSFSLRLSVSI